MIPKYSQIADLLERRIRHGDYLLKDLPSGRALASELGVGHTVVRGAVDLLASSGLLVRQANGRYKARLAPEQSPHSRQARIAFLGPAFASPFYGLCRMAVEQVGRQSGAYVRAVDYVHWDDAVIDDVLATFDGVYVMPLALDMPQNCARRFAKAKCRVVTLEHDLTRHGLPCIEVFPTEGLPALFDHLSDGGRRSVGCVNVQPEDAVTRRRIQAWRTWSRALGRTAPIIDEPVSLYGRTLVQARTVMGRLLDEGSLKCDALFVTTGEAARGVVRALCDACVAVGRDVWVGSMDDDGDARHSTPSLTALELPDLPRLVRTTMAWMLDPAQPWDGSLKLGEARPRLFVGETTQTHASNPTKAKSP